MPATPLGPFTMNARNQTLFLPTIFPIPYTGQGGVENAVSSLANAMSVENVDVVVFLPCLRKLMHPRVNVVQSLPAIFSRPFRIMGPLTRWKLDRDFTVAACARPNEQTVAWLWSELSDRLYQNLHDNRIPILREKFNSAKRSAKQILDEAYGRLGASPAHSITEQAIKREFEQLSIADYVFCPSPVIESTLIEIGIPASKLIPTSYGWEPAQLEGTAKAIPAADEPTFLFVGTVCVRKGAHLLLKYWADSKIKGRLVIAGTIEPTIREHCANLLTQSNVHWAGYVPDLGALYRSADVFILPSLEEGDPLVTYLALGSGLPALVSPMAGGRSVRNNIDGMIVDPYDSDAWITVMREFAGSKELRLEKGANAHERAQEFTWDRVGLRRVDDLRARFSVREDPKKAASH
jgi:glycosyltransferase involved in cell wall biosynthesis